MSAVIFIESLDAQAPPMSGELLAHVESRWNQGDLRRHGVPRETSGYALAVCDADVDAPVRQIEDAVAFLALHGEALRRHVGSLVRPTGELILTACLSPPAVAQEVTLPPKLVAEVASLGLSLSLRTFLSDEGDD